MATQTTLPQTYFEKARHEKFLRLAQRRLERTKDEIRLLSQLASANYQNTPEEAHELVSIVDADVRALAEAFSVEFASRVGKAASKGTTNAAGISARRKSLLDEVEIVKLLELLRQGDIESVERTLRSAIMGQSTAA